MVVREYFMTRKDGVVLVKNYSDEGRKIIQNETGTEYDVAIDVEDAPYTYRESENEPEEVPAEEALAELMEVLK